MVRSPSRGGWYDPFDGAALGSHWTVLRGTANVAAYQMARQGRLFTAGEAATPWQAQTIKTSEAASLPPTRATAAIMARRSFGAAESIVAMSSAGGKAPRRASASRVAPAASLLRVEAERSRVQPLPSSRRTATEVPVGGSSM
jgi:hypothetical protein